MNLAFLRNLKPFLESDIVFVQHKSRSLLIFFTITRKQTAKPPFSMLRGPESRSFPSEKPTFLNLKVSDEGQAREVG